MRFDTGGSWGMINKSMSTKHSKMISNDELSKECTYMAENGSWMTRMSWGYGFV
jgi:hypothetical protein